MQVISINKYFRVCAIGIRWNKELISNKFKRLSSSKEICLMLLINFKFSGFTDKLFMIFLASSIILDKEFYWIYYLLFKIIIHHFLVIHLFKFFIIFSHVSSEILWFSLKNPVTYVSLLTGNEVYETSIFLLQHNLLLALDPLLPTFPMCTNRMSANFFIWQFLRTICQIFVSCQFLQLESSNSRKCISHSCMKSIEIVKKKN